MATAVSKEVGRLEAWADPGPLGLFCGLKVRLPLRGHGTRVSEVLIVQGLHEGQVRDGGGVGGSGHRLSQGPRDPKGERLR